MSDGYYSTSVCLLQSYNVKRPHTMNDTVTTMNDTKLALIIKSGVTMQINPAMIRLWLEDSGVSPSSHCYVYVCDVIGRSYV